jgi:hypothetical protein
VHPQHENPPEKLDPRERGIEQLMTLTQRRKETARFTAFVNDPLAGAYPNERLAIRVAEKNLALAQELNDLCLQLMMAYRSAMRAYTASDHRADPTRLMFDDNRAGAEIIKRMTRRGHNALAKVLGPPPMFSTPTNEVNQ